MGYLLKNNIWKGYLFDSKSIWMGHVKSLVYEWGGVRGLQPHIRTQNHGKLPPPPPRVINTVTTQIASGSWANVGP